MRESLLILLCALGGFLAYQAQEWANSKESNEISVLNEMITSDPVINAEWIERQKSQELEQSEESEHNETSAEIEPVEDTEVPETKTFTEDF